MDTYQLNKLPPRVILYGGTGQAKVVRPIIEHYGAKVVAVFDDTPGLPSPFPDVPIYRGFDAFLDWIQTQDREGLGFSITIGNPHGRVRLRLHERFLAEGVPPVTIAHPTAFIDESAVIGGGCQIMAGAIILAGARLGRQCIINTKASVDHEDILEDGCELAPGATLCGLVHMKTNSWVCAGATVLPRLTIGADSIVGAGAVVNRDLPDGVTVVGIPARPIIKKKEQPA
ncbi:MAG TPA: acetyltransferase [Verrucomicrobiae bacterium]|nr:acetyltransferase [Verrucomicrobiae bacterium]